MKIVVFGGTTEGRIISGRLAEAGADVSVFVATPYGREEQGDTEGVSVYTGRKSSEQMEEAVRCSGLCIDATHPYAKEATVNIKKACEAEGVPYYRLKRPESPAASEAPAEDTVTVDSVADAVEWLSSQKGNILITTGSKELPLYGAAGPHRLYPRVLPLHESIDACERTGIPHRNIIAMQGPFGRELNEAIMRTFDIRFLVTKESGSAGGFAEKLEAAANCGVKTVIIARPDEDGYSLEEIYEICRRKMT